MSILGRISIALKDSRLQGKNPDGAEFLAEHRRILQSKPMMREIFLDFYRSIRAHDEKYFNGKGLRVEIGAGVSFMKSVYPDVIVTDIKPAPHLDQIVDAQNLPNPDRSLRAIYCINCFHHFPEVSRFFSELRRVLPSGSGAILIEPYYGPWARVLYRHLFSTETFDAHQAEWNIQKSVTGAMTGANQALSFLIFIRDRKKFEALFPDLEIVVMRPFTNYLRYLLSGGLNFNQLVPNWLVPAIRRLEWLIIPAQRLFALHYLIVIRKK